MRSVIQVTCSEPVCVCLPSRSLPEKTGTGQEFYVGVYPSANYEGEVYYIKNKSSILTFYLPHLMASFRLPLLSPICILLERRRTKN